MTSTETNLPAEKESNRRSIVQAEKDIQEIIDIETAALDRMADEVKSLQAKMELKNERLEALGMALKAVSKDKDNADS